MNLKSKWLFLGTLITILLEYGSPKSTVDEGEEFGALKIHSPSSHVALSGDFTVFIVKSDQVLKGTSYTNELKRVDGENSGQLENLSNKAPLLRILYLLDDISELIGEIQLEKLPSKNETISIVIPCGYFTRGGIYALRLEYKYKNLTVPVASIYQTSKIVDVKWPTPKIFLQSQVIATYPNNRVTTTIRYDETSCNPSENVPVAVYILQLIYCGSSLTACYLQNNTHTQILYYEEVRGFVPPKTIFFRCEFFGLPGNYAVQLKASNANPTAPNTSVYFKVNWSEEFKLTVHARSIYPCEGPGGVAVLFEYPSCRLEGDRVRVYGRLKADVTSVASPSSLHYITESRSIPGKHSLTFDCDLFTEKYVEYCFIYVSQAITGAMMDVKISCIPTFPFQEGDAAGWGPWSPWSPCSSSCFGGIRNRYRFCDTPPPKYGAKFCQGKAVETEFCGRIFSVDSNKNEWHNGIDSSNCHGAVLAATKPEIAAEIGSQCRCGCRVRLEEQLSRKILGANTQSCPGRSFWLLQAHENFVIGLHLDQLQFPCPGQYFRVRDGNSLNADLLTDVASDKMQFTARTLISSGENLLLEFFSDELTASGDACIGGFLAHAAVLDKKYLKRNGSITVVPLEVDSANIEKEWFFWKPAHLVTALLLVLMFVVSIFLTLQFVIKYRKYRIAEDMDSFSDVSELMPGRSKFLSTSTIISDVISMIEATVKDSPKEALCDTEEHYNSTETLTGYQDGSTMSSSTLKLNNTMESSSDKTITSIKSNCDKLLSASSILVLNKPEVKYAYPIKLRTIDLENSEPNALKLEDEKPQNNRSNLNISQSNETSCSDEKPQSSPESVLSSPSTLGSGKETKERRNREKLLQGPGSEFSLANPDSELELDYYDYNVANASAVPGSYLGMDPAFLVWIPPIDEFKLDGDDLFLGSKRNSILTLETEGAALTPSEYRRMKLSSFEDFGFEFEQGEKYLKKEEKSCHNYENLIRDESSGNSKSRTYEKLLPVRKILEDSSIKVSMESVSGVLEHKQYCVIPNRRIRLDKDDDQSEESISSKGFPASPVSLRANVESYKNKFATPKKIVQEDLSKTKYASKQKKMLKNEAEDPTNTSCKYKELVDCAQPFANKKDTVNIPMTELSGSPLSNFAHVRKLNNKDADVSLSIETFCINQGSFCDQNIRFVDDDDDDYID